MSEREVLIAGRVSLASLGTRFVEAFAPAEQLPEAVPEKVPDPAIYHRDGRRWIAGQPLPPLGNRKARRSARAQRKAKP